MWRLVAVSRPDGLGTAPQSAATAATAATPATRTLGPGLLSGALVAPAAARAATRPPIAARGVYLDATELVNLQVALS